MESGTVRAHIIILRLIANQPEWPKRHYPINRVHTRYKAKEWEQAFVLISHLCEIENLELPKQTVSRAELNQSIVCMLTHRIKLLVLKGNEALTADGLHY